jgi:hypothetical protein
MNQKEKLLPLSGEQTESHIADLCFCEFALVKVNTEQKLCEVLTAFLAAFAKLRKSSIRLVISVRMSA